MASIFTSLVLLAALVSGAPAPAPYPQAADATPTVSCTGTGAAGFAAHGTGFPSGGFHHRHGGHHRGHHRGHHGGTGGGFPGATGGMSDCATFVRILADLVPGAPAPTGSVRNAAGADGLAHVFGALEGLNDRIPTKTTK